MKQNAKPASETIKKEESSADGLIVLFIILALCLTMVLTTRIYADTAILGEIVQHYTLRGKDVLVKDDHLVFVN